MFLSAPIAGYPIIGRFGLGHSLLAWARCFIWCKDNGIPMVAPRWRYLRVGPYLRRETDKRAYHELFQSDGYINGTRKLLYLAFAQRLPFTRAVLPDLLTKGNPTLVVFTNDIARNERHFKEIISRHADIRKELLRITRKEHIPSVNIDHRFIGIHVRCGDFRSANDIQEIKSGRNVRIQIDWYVEMLRGLRNRIGVFVPAVVFSDGSLDDLRPLLGERNVMLSVEHSAIYDMYFLSAAKVIIASGSGFSMWASFLGQTPRICFPGQRRERLLGQSETEQEPECECSDDLDGDFVAYIASRLNPAPRPMSEIPK